MQKFIFVYNAKTGIGNLILDVAHKVMSPSTYPCELCQLLYGPLGLRKEWKSFMAESNMKFEFYHINDFEAKFDERFQYPIMLMKTDNGRMSVLLEKNEFSKMKNVSGLIERIKEVTTHASRDIRKPESNSKRKE